MTRKFDGIFNEVDDGALSLNKFIIVQRPTKQSEFIDVFHVADEQSLMRICQGSMPEDFPNMRIFPYSQRREAKELAHRWMAEVQK